MLQCYGNFKVHTSTIFNDQLTFESITAVLKIRVACCQRVFFIFLSADRALRFMDGKISWVDGWLFFLLAISQDWEGLRTSNLVQRWRLIRGWCAHLDFWKKFFNCGWPEPPKIGQKCQFLYSTVALRIRRNSIHRNMAPWCEWILYTLPPTGQSTKDPVTIVTYWKIPATVLVEGILLINCCRLCRCSVCRPAFVVENAEGETIFTISGPCCQCQCICCPKDIEFPVDIFSIVLM